MDIITKDWVGKLLKLYKNIVNEDESITFMNLSVIDTAKLIRSNLSLIDGVKYLRSNLPEITDIELDKDYIVSDLYGSESEILFKVNDDKYIYKLNNPLDKVPDKSDFNEYIFNILLNNYSFPKAKYDGFRIHKESNHIFMRQLMYNLVPPTQSEIYNYMTKLGYFYNDKIKSYSTEVQLSESKYDSLLFCIYDMYPKNCTKVGRDIIAFDAKYKLI